MYNFYCYIFFLQNCSLVAIESLSGNPLRMEMYMLPPLIQKGSREGVMPESMHTLFYV